MVYLYSLFFNYLYYLKVSRFKENIEIDNAILVFINSQKMSISSLTLSYIELVTFYTSHH